MLPPHVDTKLRGAGGRIVTQRRNSTTRARGAALWLVLGAAALGYGGGALALALLPTEGATPVAATLRDVPQAAEPAAPEPEAARSWAPVFGTATPEPAAEPEPEETFDYALHGLAAGGSDGWAVLDDGAGQRIVRAGDTLPGGETVREVRAEGVILDGSDGPLIVSFDPGDARDLFGERGDDDG